VWTSDGKVEGIEASRMIEAFRLPDDGFKCFPNRDYAWVNYLAEKFPENVVVIENRTAPFNKDAIY
jgi:hypothetical protein